ncbi:MAG: creatininase family protein [Mycobacteriales bacterium]
MAQLRSVWMQDLSWREIEEYLGRDKIALVPIGSTEQHGPAGPLGVDTFVALALAEDTATRAQVLSTPPLWFGDSAHHSAFPGTLTLTTTTMIAVVSDICRSLAGHGFDRIVLINGHKGSNLPALTAAVRMLHEKELPNVLFAVADPLHLARSVAGELKSTNEHHCGELELSHVEFWFPGKVRMDQLSGDSVDFEHVFGGFVGDDLFGPAPDGVDICWSGAEQRAFTPSGAFSSSLGVSVDKGRAYHEHIVRRLCELVEWLRRYDGPIGKRCDE